MGPSRTASGAGARGGALSHTDGAGAGAAASIGGDNDTSFVAPSAVGSSFLGLNRSHASHRSHLSGRAGSRKTLLFRGLRLKVCLILACSLCSFGIVHRTPDCHEWLRPGWVWLDPSFQGQSSRAAWTFCVIALYHSIARASLSPLPWASSLALCVLVLSCQGSPVQ